MFHISIQHVSYASSYPPCFYPFHTTTPHTGEDAKRIGLVDEYGGAWRAIEIAKRLAKIPDK